MRGVFWAIALGILFFSCLVIFKQDNKERTTESIARLERLATLSLKHDSYKGGFDNILMLNLTIQNSGSQDIKDPEIECTIYGESGTRLGLARQTLYRSIKAKSKLTVREFNMGLMNVQAARVGCEIVDAKG
jgi:hypothetical protein